MIGEQGFRDLMAAVCAQVTIVTAAEGGPFGTTVSAFASLSLRPPMITVALDRGSRPLRAVAAEGPFRRERPGPGQGRGGPPFRQPLGRPLWRRRLALRPRAAAAVRRPGLAGLRAGPGSRGRGPHAAGRRGRRGRRQDRTAAGLRAPLVWHPFRLCRPPPPPRS